MIFFASSVRLRFLTMLAICCAFHSISALEGLYHEDKVAEKHALPIREERSNNATPNKPDILKRLQALEEKLVQFRIFYL